jgi:hypothetical protein
LAFADGELLGIAGAIELGVGARVLRRATPIGGINAANRRGAEKSMGTLPVSTPEIGAFFFLGNALTLNIGWRGGMVIGKHGNHMLTTMLISSTGKTIVPTGGFLCPQDG